MSEKLKREMAASREGAKDPSHSSSATISPPQDNDKHSQTGSLQESCFVNLHTHSAYSLLEGALPLAKLIELAKADNQPALAVTDTNNLFGALEFSEKAAAIGVQPIIGVSLEVDFASVLDQEPDKDQQMNGFPKLVLLATNETGYANLMKLGSAAYLETESGERPHISAESITAHSQGVICLTGGPDGPLDLLLANGNQSVASTILTFLSKQFEDRIYVEIQRPSGFRRAVEDALVALAYENNLPLVATNSAYFAKREDYEAHDALICIAQSRVIIEDDRRKLSPDNYLRSRTEMHKLFEDLPEAISNTIEIAKRCTFKVPKLDPILPSFTGADPNDAEAALAAEYGELERQAKSGLDDRLERFGLVDGFTRKDYDERLAYELGVIRSMGFPGYFLIVADFIGWAKQQQIPVGPGRGSGAGSLVAWSLLITDLDPMRFSLLFERFLNPERISMPDFDIDFCQDRRDEVIRYVQQKYGRDQVAQIITFGSLQARAVLRDVGRVLQIPYGQVDRLCKMVPNNPANPTTLAQAIEGEPRFAEAREQEKIVGKLLDISLKLEGLYRHASTHAAGIVIGDRPLDQLVPLYRDPRSDMPVTQFNMKWVEQAGLVKFDFLGLKTLTVLETAVELVANRNVKVDLETIPIDDEKTYEMLQRGETVGVFQLESQGMRKALLGMKPDRLEDIIALVALYRPGPMENIPTYNARKHGEEEADYYHEKIEGVLKETHGVIIYQEQVMEIAQVLSGYSLGEADVLRRAMGKKIRAEMDKQRSRFINGATDNGLTKSKANEIFDLLAKFADYGFNKSHAAAYALVSYQTAYMKANYPVEYLAACMTLDMGNTDKLSDYYREGKRSKIEILAPSVNISFGSFAVADDKIFYSLAAIKGVGEQAVEHIVERRKEKPFASITDFFSRIDPKLVNRRTIENLIFAGAFDEFNVPREQLSGGLDRLIGHAARTSQNDSMGISDMFGGEASGETIQLPLVQSWLPSEKLQKEFQAVGFYLSAHPLDEYQDMLESLRVQSYADFERSVKLGAEAGRLAGTVNSIQERKTRTGNKMGIVQISDPSGQYEAVIFSESLVQFRDLLQTGNSVLMLVGAEDRPEGVSIRIQQVKSLEAEASKVQHNMRIFLRDEAPVLHIHKHLSSNSGVGSDGEVSLIYLDESAKREIEIKLKGRYPTGRQHASAMKAIPGVVEVELT